MIPNIQSILKLSRIVSLKGKSLRIEIKVGSIIKDKKIDLKELVNKRTKE